MSSCMHNMPSCMHNLPSCGMNAKYVIMHANMPSCMHNLPSCGMNAQYAIMHAQLAIRLIAVCMHNIASCMHNLPSYIHNMSYSDIHSRYVVMYAHITIMCIQYGNTCIAIPTCATLLKLRGSFICFKIAPYRCCSGCYGNMGVFPGIYLGFLFRWVWIPYMGVAHKLLGDFGSY